MIAKLLHANSRYLALVMLAIVVVGYTSMSGMARKEDPAITPWFAKIQIFFPGASPRARVGSTDHQTHGGRTARRA